MANSKKYFVVRASGGLSNRLQAILGGIAYCLLTGRTLCIDWRDGLYSDDFSNVFPLWFQINGVSTATCDEVLANFTTGAAVFPSFWQEYLPDAVAVEYLFANNEHMAQHSKTAYNFHQMALLGLENLRAKDAEAAPILVYWGWDLQGINSLAPLLQQAFPEYAEKDIVALQRAVLQKHILPAQSVQQEVQAFYQDHFHTAPYSASYLNKAPIGIHIRHSDLQSPLPRMLAKLQEVYQDGDAIFLCTDNVLVEKMVQRLYPHCVTRTKTFQGVNVPLHCYVEGISNVQKGFDAVVEMLLLAQCRQIIYYAPSSFSRISLLYSHLGPAQIHAVPKHE